MYSIGVSNRDAKSDVLQGTLDIMIMQTLATLGASHGYAIAARIEQVSGGRVRLNMGTLYPGLMRLEHRARACRSSRISRAPAFWQTVMAHDCAGAVSTSTKSRDSR